MDVFGFCPLITIAYESRHLWQPPLINLAFFNVFKKQIILVLWSAADIICSLARILFEN